MRPRTKTRKSAAPLDAALAFDGLGARQLPPVLTPAAVAKGLMPPLGVSALPPSLEQAIPVELRYWTAKDAEEARAVRDELVERAVVKASDLLVVDGAVRRVVWQAFLAVEDEAPTPLAKRTPAAVAGAACLVPLPGVETIAICAGELDGDDLPWTAERTAKAIQGLGQRVCIALSDTPANRAALAGLTSTFALETRPGVVYGSPLAIDPDATHVVPIAPAAKAAPPPVGSRVYVDPSAAHMPEASGPGTVAEIGGPAIGVRFDSDPDVVHRWVVAEELSPMPDDAEKRPKKPGMAPGMAMKQHAVRLVVKADAPPAEERYVFGVVLEPDVVDSQNDTYSAEEVRKAAHRFMEAHAQLGKQHSEIVTGKLKILESYVAPVDFAVGEQVIKAGTWLLAIRVVDDELWTAVKAGSFTGFSIGGTAIRQPDAGA